MGLVEIFWTDVERCELGQGGGGAKTALLDIFDFVVGDEVLGDASDGEGEGLVKGVRKVNGEGDGNDEQTFFMRPSALNL